MVKLNLQQIKKIELDILKEFVAYCDKHSLRYYLAYGSLIGAIRHHGFIPWDEDIDVMMPRSDYEKLHELVKAEPVGEELDLVSYTLGTYRVPIGKIVNKNTRVSLFGRGLEEKLWVDIFVLDNYDSKIAKSNAFWYKVYIARDTRHFDFSIKGIVKYFINVLFCWKKPADIVQKMEKNAMSVPYNGNYSHILWTDFKEPIFTEHDLSTPCLVDFEGLKLKTFSNYDDVLTLWYGDYMTLPPENQRRTHNLEAYWISDKDIPEL